MTAVRIRSGFTLVEVLIALLVFAILAAAGSAVLSTTITNRLAVKQASDRVADLQRMRALLKADLGQATTRRFRDLNGAIEPQAMATGVEADGALLTLTRAGWTNPGAAPRASMQQVEYRLVDGRLERRFRARLDGSRLGPPQVLQRGITDLRIAFVSQGRQTDVWVATTERPLPDAVRIDMTLPDYGPVTQMFLVGGPT